MAFQSNERIYTRKRPHQTETNLVGACALSPRALQRKKARGGSALDLNGSILEKRGRHGGRREWQSILAPVFTDLSNLKCVAVAAGFREILSLRVPIQGEPGFRTRGGD